MNRSKPFIIAVAPAAFASVALAEQPVIYLVKNQKAQQQQRPALNTCFDAYGACMEERGHIVKQGQGSGFHAGSIDAALRH